MVYPHTFATQPAGNVPASFLDDNFNAALQASNNLSDVGNAATARANLGIIGSAGLPNIRQTVNGGPVVAATGVPSFLPASSVTLNLTTQNVTSATPLTCTAANNVLNTSGANNDAFGFSVANLTWAGLTNATTNYLYVTITPATGVMTPGFTTLPPLYQFGGVPAVTAGQFTFNKSTMQGFLGNGATAPQSYIVFLGEAVTAGGQVTSTVAYSYNGIFDSGFTATLPGTLTAITSNHNLGVTPTSVVLVLENTTNDNGYVVGDQLFGTSTASSDATPSYVAPAIWTNRNTTGFITPSLSPFRTWNKTTGSFFSLTAASWKYKFVVSRGW